MAESTNKTNKKRLWVVVTGAGSGIGKAVVQAFAGIQDEDDDGDGKKNRYLVLAVGRRLEPLKSLLNDGTNANNKNNKNIVILSADVSSSSGRKAIHEAIPTGENVQFLIHCAAILQPKPLMEVEENEFHQHMAINTEGPLFLAQALLDRFLTSSSEENSGGSGSNGCSDRSRILHISSSGAHTAKPGWGSYCISKAALHMVYRMLDLELHNSHGIRVGSVRPGIVNTPMRDQIRGLSGRTPPSNNATVLSPEHVATFIVWLLMKSAPDEFASEEWDIYNEKHHQYWASSETGGE